jgi:hypothetical protein
LTFAFTPDRDEVQSRYVIDPSMNYIPGVIVGLQWALQGNMPGQQAAEMQAEADRLAELHRWAEDGVPAQVIKADEDARRAELDVDESRRSIEDTKKWLVLAESDYSAGLSDSRSFTDALQAYVVIRSRLFESIFRLNVALAELSRMVGALGTKHSELYPGRQG